MTINDHNSEHKSLFGFLNVNKPRGMTSHDVVAKLRRATKTHFNQNIKIGHAGTLDPMATGVLVICLGPATQLSEYVMDTTKGYRARVRLGVSTDTYDAEGEIISERDATQITREDVLSGLTRFTGDIDQMPPMYSAIKQGGRKLYELAREGKTVDRAARQVRIDLLNLIDWEWPEFTVDVICGAGTYIRSLAHDLGELLGCGAHLTALTRTASGSFALENSVSLETLLQTADWTPFLAAPEIALTQFMRLELDSEALDHVLHGRPIVETGSAAVPGAFAVGVSSQGRLVAILRCVDENGQNPTTTWQPYKVFLRDE